jgi:PilZ domain-containing protein
MAVHGRGPALAKGTDSTMSPSPLHSKLAKSAHPFLRMAQRQGLPAKMAKKFQPTVAELYPNQEGSIFETRERFEETALRALQPDLNSLEISFVEADQIAQTLENLNLGQPSDAPDPLRRVWLQNGLGDRRRGVVLSCTDEEVTILCSVKGPRLGERGGTVRLCYRGPSAEVQHDLQLLDAVRLPHTHVLHLGQRNGGGFFGRTSKRHHVEIVGFVQEVMHDDQPASPVPCKIRDLSIGGARLECRRTFDRGTTLHLDIFLDDGITETFSVDCIARWSEALHDGHHVGLQFCGLSQALEERLEKVIQTFRS